MAETFVQVNMENDEKANDMQQVVIENKNVPLKYTYPKPVPLITKNGKAFIIIISSHQDKRCVGYDIAEGKYFKLCEYPDVKLVNHTVSISSDYKYIYSFDGTKALRSYIVFELDINGDKPKLIKMKKSVPRGGMNDQRNIITAGKQILSICLPSPYNEFHIIGGSLNINHLKWDSKIKKFVNLCGTTNIVQSQINKQKLVSTEILFSMKQKQFYLLAPNSKNEIWTKSYPSTESNNYIWCKSLKLRIPYDLIEEFGAILYKQQYIIIFGGYGGQKSVKNTNPLLTGFGSKTIPLRKELDDIYIIDIESGLIQKSKIKCPQKGRFYAVYIERKEILKKHQKFVHLFSRFGTLKHWTMNLHSIMTQIEIDDVAKETSLEFDDEKKKQYQQQYKENININDDSNDLKIHTLNDCKHHIDALYKKIGYLQNEIETLKNEKNNNYQYLTKTDVAISLKQWLKDNDLSEYYSLFNQQGIDDLYTLSLLTVQELENIGVKKIGHRKKIVAKCKFPDQAP